MPLGIAPRTHFEVVEVGGEAQVIVLPRGQLLLEYGWISRRKISYRSGRILRVGRRAWMIEVHGLETHRMIRTEYTICWKASS